MARTQVDTSAITAARTALKAADLEFRERKAREWDALSSRLRIALEDAVYAAKDAGASVSKIAAAYGTSDRRTILNILDKKPVQIVTPEAAVNARYVGQFIEVQAFGERVAFKDVADFPMFDTSLTDYQANGTLATALRDDVDFYTKVLQTAANNQALEA